tara:strand:+ start:10667 stop:12091 length:1425 start_codon:yes stop_codon:yes gene_type:complete
MGKFNELYEKQVLISEAFDSAKMGKAVKLIKAYLTKKIGKMYNTDVQEFSNKFGDQVGIRYALSNGQEIRFNWQSSGGSSAIASIDIWDSSKNPTPKVHIDTSEISVAKFLPELVSVIKNPSPGDVPVMRESITEKDIIISEAKVKIGKVTYASGKEAIVALTHKGHTPDQIQQMTGLTAKGVLYHMKQALKAVPGAKEKVKVDTDTKKAEKQTSEIQYADPEVIYKDLESLINLVVSGIQPSLVISGGAGTGKTFTVKKLLKEKGYTRGNDWKLVKGQTTPKGLYASLFLNRDKLIVFDDTDSIWKDKLAVNILKAALDSDDERLISWQSNNSYDPSLPPYDILPGQTEYEAQRGYFAEKQMLPNEFIFDGEIIFLTNLQAADLDQAVKNRSYVIDVTLSPEDVIKRVESIIPNFTIKDKPVPKADQLEAFEAFKNITKHNSGYISIRTFIQFLKTKSSGAPNWIDLAIKYST